MHNDFAEGKGKLARVAYGEVYTDTTNQCFLPVANASVYWPVCDDQIRNMVTSCDKCQELKSKNPPLPFRPLRVPVFPFQFVSVDLFYHGCVNFLLVVDLNNKWPPSRTSTCLMVSELDRMFAEFGTPEEMKSDNGPQFASQEFKAFCSEKGVQHVTSSPEFPQSNEQAERAIQTV